MADFFGRAGPEKLRNLIHHNLKGVVAFRTNSPGTLGAMATYQCLFFKEQRIGYWENVAAVGDRSILALLEERLAKEDWEAAEAWRNNMLICRAVRPGSASPTSACPGDQNDTPQRK